MQSLYGNVFFILFELYNSQRVTLEEKIQFKGNVCLRRFRELDKEGKEIWTYVDKSLGRE